MLCKIGPVIGCYEISEGKYFLTYWSAIGILRPPQPCLSRYFGSVTTCPYLSALLRSWVSRDAGIKGPAIREYNRDAGNMGQALSLLAALMDCIPGFNTAQLEELLLKLPVRQGL